MKLLAIQPACCRDEKAAILIEGITSGSLSCPSCGKAIGELVQDAGLIYVLSSSAFPDTYKIGFTLRDINERLDELNRSTSLPSPFVVEMMFVSLKPLKDEAKIHMLFSEHRINERREFFRLPLLDIHNQLVAFLMRSPYFLSRSLQHQIVAYQNELKRSKLSEKVNERISSVQSSLDSKKVESKSSSRRFGLLP